MKNVILALGIRFGLFRIQQVLKGNNIWGMNFCFICKKSMSQSYY